MIPCYISYHISFFTRSQYTNTVPQNLLDALRVNWPSNRFNSSAESIFNSYTTQVGYPLINAELSTNGRSVTFSQKRFLISPDVTPANNTLRYTVPISYTTSEEKNFVDTTPKVLLANATGVELIVNLSSTVSWIIANIQQTGYYRVNYTESNWHAIHHALTATNWSGIHEVNRAHIVDDLLNLARAGDIHYNLTLSVLEYLESETNYIPWTSAFNGFNWLAIRLGRDTTEFSTYIKQLTAKAYSKLGFNETPDDSALDIYLRTKVLSWSCRYGHTDCINQAKAQFNSLSNVPKNIRSVVYCVALREGGSFELDELYQKFKTETVATEETLLQNSFGCVKTQELIERVFNLVLSDEIRRQDKSSVLATLYTENNENVTPVFELVTANYIKLAEA